MEACTVTYRNGQTARLENVFIRGSKIRFLILPDMLKRHVGEDEVGEVAEGGAQAGLCDIWTFSVTQGSHSSCIQWLLSVETLGSLHTSLAYLVHTSDVGFIEGRVVSSVLVDTAGARVEVEEGTLLNAGSTLVLFLEEHRESSLEGLGGGLTKKHHNHQHNQQQEQA
ncbi:Small nuclear ribonucleoprotein Sm D3 [Portunus trituberculatus]|uniref:Small nuclear ribonucleoprotein Sm D3 n=1 Tax=Portunus trituberculatus TaxID=210409 RepID=A0A5B7E9E7_PORTR|nr:Small nuclear ribonucleoprotein Sm D3 [Portunus trituberculatus]